MELFSLMGEMAQGIAEMTPLDAPVVVLEGLLQGGVVIVLQEAVEHVGLGPSEAIDGLVVIPHHRDAPTFPLEEIQELYLQETLL